MLCLRVDSCNKLQQLLLLTLLFRIYLQLCFVVTINYGIEGVLKSAAELCGNTVKQKLISASSGTDAQSILTLAGVSCTAGTAKDKTWRESVPQSDGFKCAAGKIGQDSGGYRVCSEYRL